MGERVRPGGVGYRWWGVWGLVVVGLTAAGCAQVQTGLPPMQPSAVGSVPVSARASRSAPISSIDVPSSKAPSTAGPSSETPRYGTTAAPIKMRATGQVLAPKTGNVLLCPPYDGSLVGTVSVEPQTPTCLHGIPVSGVDLDAMSLAGHNTTARWGQVHVEAMWDGRALTVTSQRTTTTADSPAFVQQPVTCPAPASGWIAGSTQDDPGIDKIKDALGGAVYGGLAIGYPHGAPTDEGGQNPSDGLQNTEQVVVVGVTGDLATATTVIRTVFKGNLCVVHSDVTDAQVQQQQAALEAGISKGWSTLGIMAMSQTQKALGVPGPIQIDVVVETPELDKALRSLPGAKVEVVPWLAPVG